MAKIYIASVRFLALPLRMLISVLLFIPSRMPFEIEYDIGIIIIQMKAGIDSEKLSSSIFLIGSSISKPTIINTGAVAAGGIERNSGERNRVTAKQQATTNAVRPVRPP